MSLYRPIFRTTGIMIPEMVIIQNRWSWTPGGLRAVLRNLRRSGLVSVYLRHAVHIHPKEFQLVILCCCHDMPVLGREMRLLYNVIQRLPIAAAAIRASYHTIW